MTNFLVRRSFGRESNLVQSSNLINLQMESYSEFLQRHTDPMKRLDQGFQSVLKEVLTLKDPNAKNHVEFISYDMKDPEYTEDECVARGKTFCSSVKVNLRLIRFVGKASEGVISEVKEQSIFLCDMPLMCSNGGFVIKGINRIVVSQLHKSSGVFFNVDDFKSQGIKKLYSANIIPHRGAWIDFEIDYKGFAWAKIDKRRKISLSAFLMLFGLKSKEEGFSKQEILDIFYDKLTYKKHSLGWKIKFCDKWLKNFRPHYNLLHPKTGEILVQAGKTVTLKKKSEIEELGGYCIAHESLIGMYLTKDLCVDDKVFQLGYEVDEALLGSLESSEIKEVDFLNIDHSRFSSVIRDTLVVDKNTCIEEALLSFYKVLRPGEVASLDGARYLFYSTFCDSDRYDFSMVGRVKINNRLKKYYNNDKSKESKVLTVDDVIAVVKCIVAMRDGQEHADNIDHLSCRRVRSVGELVSNQSRGALYKISKSLKDRLGNAEVEEGVDLFAIFQSKVLISSLKEFFGTSQLSQIMDNLNPLSKLAHCRRVTAMGRGGVVASRAADSMRDVGESYYGRICPVETPEGQNIGLISYLSVYSKINEYGFLQSPYKKVENGIIKDEVIYLDAQEEEQYSISPYCVSVNSDGKILDETVACRKGEDYVTLKPEEIDYIDVSSGQILSVAASLIPFIENDDPSRALMGSNMQRQAVPLKVAEAPFVGTGMEERIGIDSMVCVVAHTSGKVVYVDSSKIFVQNIENPNKIDTYFLKKFERSNSYSCVNHKVIVSIGDIVKVGQVLADGSSIDKGEIALGKNLRIAFLPFKGCTFEDAIVISERLLNDKLTSVKIEEIVVSIKEGESIIRSIPGVSEEFVKNLDEVGIVTLGAKVKEGEVLVGRVVPKLESISTPEERLLKAMFGEKSINYSDASLRVPPGCAGTIIDVKIFNKKESDKDERSLLLERIELNKLKKNRDLELKIIFNRYEKQIIDLLEGETVADDCDSVSAGTVLSSEELNLLSFDSCKCIHIENASKQKLIDNIYSEARSVKKGIVEKFDNLSKKISLPTDLPNGVIKQVKVFIATNRVIEAGDKMAGRHGNKGVVSKVLPVEDMPFDENGEPIDVILNSLGVAARMNIGQVFEVALGWISHEVGRQISNLLGAIYNLNKNYEDLRVLLKKAYPSSPDLNDMSEEQLLEVALKIANGMPFAVPSFDGAKLNDIKTLLTEWDLPLTGKAILRDGETGETYPNPITVGYMYLMKLNHMVADKIHARSTGAYSLITQQPPGGRAKMGGQRKGEMEIWALQAYGAAYLTKESMTIKSDDHVGRVAAYEAITKGQEVVAENNTPESFKVLMQELRAVMLNTECLSKHVVDGVDQFTASGSGADFDALRISLMSPEKIKSYSFGEVKKAETLNYRTQKAEIGGLHCPVVFGPEKDYRCACGRYSKMKYRGIVCEKCNVEVTVSRVRRERMGHIELACPVAHIWFTKILPSSIGLMLDLTSKDLDKILRYESYIIVSAGITPLEDKQLMNEEEYSAAKLEYGSTSFIADMGAEAIEALLKNINLEEEKSIILERLNAKPNDLLRKKLIKKLRMVNGFIENKTRPEWMIIRILPVLPADLRPLVALDGGRFATPDSNDLYRRVINRNNRLKTLEGFPEIVQRNEKRMISAAVNAVIDNSRVDQPFLTSNGRPLQSIGDLLKGKQGRFRQNLLGKRVDFSGRSVIVVGPNLKLHQCGLPKKMAVELFKPFIYARLEQYGYAVTLRSAKKIVEERRPEVWEILKEVVYQHPILLNRPPTLHRLGIQAFECVLIDSNAIQLHPLVCAAFNADFDGDQMSVHVPLSIEAQLEARILMMPSNNLLSPANGQPIMAPKKDMILGLYYLTNLVEGRGDTNIVLNQYEVEKAIDNEQIHFNQEITAVIDCPVEGKTQVKTTGGRVILYNSLPFGHQIAFSDVNKLLLGSGSSKLFEMAYKNCKRSDVVEFADTLMALGFKYSTLSCASLGIDDLITLDCKEKVVGETKSKINEYDRQFKEGLITRGEKRNKVAEAWLKCDTYLAKQMELELSKKIPGKDPNSVYMMYHSGARGSTAQMKQIMAMRGLVIKPNGEWVEDAISRSYKDGLDTLSYFIATHGTRKGFTDMALKTADAGYFTRKLVEVAQDCIITSKSCDVNDIEENIVKKCITFEPINKNGFFDYSGAEGRIIAEDIVDPDNSNKILFCRYHMLTKNDLDILSKHLILSIKIRSPITCTSDFGICCTCYGLDLSKAKMVSIGEPVGVVAAQSIGEPGAQLTMRTFHSGGGSVGSTGESSVTASSDGIVKFINARIHKKENGVMILLSRDAEVVLIDDHGRQRSKNRLPYGSKIFFSDGDSIKQGSTISEWDQNIIPRLATYKGYVEYKDLIEGISLKKFIDEASGLSSRIVTDFRKLVKKKNSINPAILLKDENGSYILSDDGLPISYKLEVDDVIMVENGSYVEIGDLVIKKQKMAARSSDITAGLPKLVEIFEARLPKIQAVMSEIDGVVVFNKDNKFKRFLSVTAHDGSESKEYMISKDINILVQSGENVKKGDPISEGNIASHDILKILGVEALVLYLLKSIKEIFTSQGMVVDNKHVECIIRYMLRKVEVIDAKSSDFVNGEVIDIWDYKKMIKDSNLDFEHVPEIKNVLQGITKASSMDISFLKSASFQEPHKALINACLSTKSIDHMNGMKEALITGKLIPAGTGVVGKQWGYELNEQFSKASNTPDEVDLNNDVLADNLEINVTFENIIDNSIVE